MSRARIMNTGKIRNRPSMRSAITLDKVSASLTSLELFWSVVKRVLPSGFLVVFRRVQ